MNFYEFSFGSLKSNFVSALDASNHILDLTHTMFFSLRMLKLISFKKIRSTKKMFVFIYQHQSTTTRLFTHSVYLSLFMFNVVLILAPTQHAYTYQDKLKHQHIPHLTSHEIIQSIRMTAFYICAPCNGSHRRRDTERETRTSHSKCNKIYRFCFVTQNEHTHAHRIYYMYTRSFCFMSKSIEFMRNICLKSTNDTVLYHTYMEQFNYFGTLYSIFIH